MIIKIIYTIIYIDKYIEKNDIYTKSYNIYKLFLIYLTISTKFWNDIYYKNNYYCKVGGIDIKEFNKLEIELLFGIDFELIVKDDIYIEYENHIMTHVHLCTFCDIKKRRLKK